MDDELRGILAKLEELSQQLEHRKREILGANPADFIAAFVSVAAVVQTLQRTQDVLEPRADFMVKNEQETIHRLRKDQFRVL